MGWLYLVLALFGVALTANVFWPNLRHATLSVWSWIGGFLVGEAALVWIGVQALGTLAFAWAGAFSSPAGQIGLALTAGSWLALVLAYRRGGRHAATAIQRALGSRVAQHVPVEPASWSRVVRAFPSRPDAVEVTRGLHYGRAAGQNLLLDVYRKKDAQGPRPALLHIHGGAWQVGDRRGQGLPLIHTLAERGWVCVSIDYRLSPGATFPDHLVDAKRALAWMRGKGLEYGIDPGCIVVTGGSAGAHLASLVALTPNEPMFQPAFEDADTSIQGCISCYGIYDFADRERDWPHDALRKLLERSVMKASLEEERGAYDRASPLCWIHASAPPFLIVHGDNDSLVPVAQGRRFSERLAAASRNDVIYAEIPGAQHAFEILWSPRTQHFVTGAVRFAEHVAARERDRGVLEDRAAQSG